MPRGVGASPVHGQVCTLQMAAQEGPVALAPSRMNQFIPNRWQSITTIATMRGHRTSLAGSLLRCRRIPVACRRRESWYQGERLLGCGCLMQSGKGHKERHADICQSHAACCNLPAMYCRGTAPSTPRTHTAADTDTDTDTDADTDTESVELLAPSCEPADNVICTRSWRCIAHAHAPGGIHSIPSWPVLGGCKTLLWRGLAGNRPSFPCPTETCRANLG